MWSLRNKALFLRCASFIFPSKAVTAFLPAFQTHFQYEVLLHRDFKKHKPPNEEVMPKINKYTSLHSDGIPHGLKLNYRLFSDDPCFPWLPQGERHNQYKNTCLWNKEGNNFLVRELVSIPTLSFLFLITLQYLAHCSPGTDRCYRSYSLW